MAASASLLFISPCLPHVTPIEIAFDKLKTPLCKAAARPVDHLWRFIGGCLGTFTAEECANHFATVSYDAIRSKMRQAQQSVISQRS